LFRLSEGVRPLAPQRILDGITRFMIETKHLN
jgi:hypothetical protein